MYYKLMKIFFTITAILSAPLALAGQAPPPPPPPPASIPVLDSPGLIGLGLLVAIVGSRFVKKRK